MALIKKKLRRKLSRKVLKLLLKHGEKLVLGWLTGVAGGAAHAKTEAEPTPKKTKPAGKKHRRAVDSAE